MYTAFSVLVMSLVSGGVVLVINGHPWFGLLCFIVLATCSTTDEKKGG